MEPDPANQSNIDETNQLNGEFAPVEIFFGSAFISLILVLVAVILMFISVLAG